MDKREAATWIAKMAKDEISVHDCVRFIEVIESELISLHMDNIARYRLRPFDFAIWKDNWR